LTLLEEVLKSVDAFKKDMEDLGVEIHVGVKEVEYHKGPKTRGLLCLLVREDLEEDLEAEA